MNFDAFDVDLSNSDGERVSGGAALEVAAAALLAGSGLGHREKVWRGRVVSTSGFCSRGIARGLVSGGLVQRHRFSGRGFPRGKSLARELHHVVEGVEFLQLSGAEVTERDGVGLGPDQGAVLLTDFSGMHGHAHLLLGMVSVGANVEVIDEGQHLGAMTAQPFGRPLGVTVRPGGGDELIEPSMEAVVAPFLTVRRHSLTALPETTGIAQQTSELFAEASPGRPSSELVHLHEFGKEVKVALLLGECFEGVVGAPEVGNEDAGEHRSEDGLDRHGAAYSVDQVVAALARGEGPQPVGNSIDPRSRLIGMQHGAGAHLLADPFIAAFQQPGEIVRRLRQPARTDGKAEQRRGDFDAGADAGADRVMQPGGEHDKVQPQGRVRQGRRDRSGYDLATGATPIAVGRVFGDLRGDRGNVFANARVDADRIIKWHRTHAIVNSADVTISVTRESSVI